MTEKEMIEKFIREKGVTVVDTQDTVRVTVVDTTGSGKSYKALNKVKYINTQLNIKERQILNLVTGLKCNYCGCELNKDTYIPVKNVDLLKKQINYSYLQCRSCNSCWSEAKKTINLQGVEIGKKHNDLLLERYTYYTCNMCLTHKEKLKRLKEIRIELIAIRKNNKGLTEKFKFTPEEKISLIEK